MVEQKWTTKMVVDRLEEAASTLRRLPRVSPKGFSSSWPTIVQEFMEAYGESEVHLRLGPPPGEAITRMDECLEWMRWLEPNSARLVWWRAVKTPWKNITAKLGQDRTTVWRRWNLAISWIAARLDATQEKNVATKNVRNICNKKWHDSDHTGGIVGNGDPARQQTIQNPPRATCWRVFLCPEIPAMSLDPYQLRLIVIRPTLNTLGLWSKEAEELVLGTAIQESNLRYLRQMNGGPAIGLWQMEPATHKDIWDNYLAHRAKLAMKVLGPYSRPDPGRMAWDLAYGCAMCRVHYLRAPEAIPPAGEVVRQAEYWSAT